MNSGIELPISASASDVPSLSYTACTTSARNLCIRVSPAAPPHPGHVQRSRSSHRMTRAQPRIALVQP
eukprot:2953578-Rhodomonas_salina.1